MDNQPLIVGKIAKVQDKYRVIINKGRLDGVKPGMRFYVYDEGEEIVDPDTGKFIEKEEIVKGYLKTIHVQDNISILQSDEKETVVITPPGSFLPSQQISRLFGETREVMKPLNTNIDETNNSDSVTPKEEDHDRKIKRGNFVKQVPNN